MVRTFPTHPLFHEGICERILSRVLLTAAAERPDVGYCQGMNYVTGIMIISRLGTTDMLGMTDFAEFYDLREGSRQNDQKANQSTSLALQLPGTSPGRRSKTSLLFARWQRIISSLTPTDIHKVECDVLHLLLLLLQQSHHLQMASLWRGGVPKMRLRVYQVCLLGLLIVHAF